MPIYEFLCRHCNTIFNFYSKTVNTQKQPCCPRCSRILTRQVSLFACIDPSRKEGGAEDLPLDETKLEHAIGSLAAEAEHISEDSPRQAANLMRRFTDLTGVKLGSFVVIQPSICDVAPENAIPERDPYRGQFLPRSTVSAEDTPTTATRRIPTHGAIGQHRITAKMP